MESGQLADRASNDIAAMVRGLRARRQDQTQWTNYEKWFAIRDRLT
jgi:hypothetical protein